MQNINNKAFVHDMAKKLLAYMKEGNTHMIDENSSIDTAEFSDPVRFEKEKNGLFRKTPLMMGFSCDFPESGSFRLNEDAGVSVLLTRNKQGKVKAFLNACSHRGARLTEEKCGNRSRFTCPYHAWTYSNDGDLLAINQQDYFGEMDKATLGLVEFACEEKYGMIFVILTPGAKLDLESWFGDAAAYMQGWNFEQNTLAAERDLVTSANWKITLDTFCEGYHFPVLHAADFDFKVSYCAHHWQFGYDNRHWAVAWPSKSLEELRDKPESEWGNPQDHFSIIHFIYPNTIMAVYPQTCSVWNIYPGEDVNKQITRMRFFSRIPNASEEEKKLITHRLELFYKVLQEEDYWISGGIHQNIQSGLMPQFVLGRNEPGPGWVHQALNKGLAELADH